jgi:anthranilate phosphoribosyltransferase
MLNEYLARVVEREDLSEEEAHRAMNHIMSGEALPTQIAAFLTALRMKGETWGEITGLARAMRSKAIAIQPPDGEPVVDTCGTGGDHLGTFNISTAVAFAAAGGGLTVAKHGNRSVSSRCGSADVLEALGVNIALSPHRVEECLREIRMAFLFAPLFHPAMKYALGPRREIGIRTVFNLLGPLTNPAGARIQVLGVYRKELLRPVAEVLRHLGSQAAWVVHGEDHCDEISICGKTWVCQLQGGEIRSFWIEPEMAGFRKARLGEIQGGTAAENAQILLRVLKGEKGPCRDVVLLNAAAVFSAAGKARDFQEGVERARESIDSGKALAKLEELRRYTPREA